MKKLVLLSLALLLAVVVAFVEGPPAFAWSDGYSTATITGGVGVDNQTSTAVTLPRGTDYIAFYLPTLTSSTVTFYGSHDGGTTYDNVICQDNGTTTVAWATAATTGSQYVIPPPTCRVSFFNKIKVYCGTAQASDRSVIVIFKKDPTKSNQ